MPIRLGQFGNFNTSRVKKIMSASNQDEATHMGGWDKFKDYFSGGAKQIRLNNLWTHLQSNLDQATDNPNIKKFITFTKIKDLANNEHRNQFTANLEKSNIGLTSKLRLQINNQNILVNDNVSLLEHNVISHFIDQSGQIKVGTNKYSVTQQQQQQQDAIKKISKAFITHRTKIHSISAKPLKILKDLRNKTFDSNHAIYDSVMEFNALSLSTATSDIYFPRLEFTKDGVKHHISQNETRIFEYPQNLDLGNLAKLVLSDIELDENDNFKDQILNVAAKSVRNDITPFKQDIELKIQALQANLGKIADQESSLQKDYETLQKLNNNQTQSRASFYNYPLDSDNTVIYTLRQISCIENFAQDVMHTLDNLNTSNMEQKKIITQQIVNLQHKLEVTNIFEKHFLSIHPELSIL